MTSKSTNEQHKNDTSKTSCEDKGDEAAGRMAGHNTPADDSEKNVKPERQNSVETTSQDSSYTTGWEISLASSYTAGRQGSVASSYTAGREGSVVNSWTVGRSESRSLSPRSDEVEDVVGGHDDEECGDSGSED